MQNIVIDKPYQFVPPRHSDLWPILLRSYLPKYLRESHGIETYDFRGLDHLKSSLAAGHGVMLAPNHCRPCDPMVIGQMTATLGQPIYIMASWHLFMQGWFMAWLLPRIGVFSVYREGLDREALKCAVQILVDARRPLVVFAEGAISRTNDRLNHLMEGTVFMARNAAKQRASQNPPGKVVIHPVAIRYFFEGDLEKSLTLVLEEIEKRLSWRPRSDQPLVDRIIRVGDALLTLKEMEYFGKAQTGALAERMAVLIDHILVPLEKEWLKGKREGDVISRVKSLRTAILPDMVAGEIDEAERARRWAYLSDLYLAQQLYFYPPDYFTGQPTREQLLETVERYEEDLTDEVRVHRPLRVVVEVGEALEVSTQRERDVETDPLMVKLRGELEAMLARLKAERGGKGKS